MPSARVTHPVYLRVENSTAYTVIVTVIVSAHKKPSVRITGPPEAAAASCLQQHRSYRLPSESPSHNASSCMLALNTMLQLPDRSLCPCFPVQCFCFIRGGQLRRDFGRSFLHRDYSRPRMPMPCRLIFPNSSNDPNLCADSKSPHVGTLAAL